MRLDKNILVKGLLLGFTTGLIVTFFDSFFMLIPNLYIPSGYPFHLLMLNTVFWTTVGGLSGSYLSIATRRKQKFYEREDLYWVFSFLLPFTMLYGALGRFHMPVYAWLVSYGSPVFDHHLSFVWVALVMLFLIAFFSKRKSGNYVSSNYFIAELITIIILFQFCSNLKKYPYCDQANTYLLITVYVIGILMIGGLYLLSFYALHYFTIHSKRRSSYTKIGVLSIIVPICLISFYAWGHKNSLDTQLSSSSDEKRVIHKKVPQVILIVLDTVRADRISLYGNCGTTKNLEEFAKGALVFENCVAPSPHTLPSHASIFTGLYPAEHGSHGDLSAKSKTIFGFPIVKPLSEKYLTLAEIFADNGYQTAAIVSNAIVLNPEFRLNQGFQIADAFMSIGHIYHTYPFRPILHPFSCISNLYPKYFLYYRTADDITSESTHVLKNLSSEPFFLFINYLDAHDPYHPPRPYHGYFTEKIFPQLYKLEQYVRRYIIKKWDQKDWITYQLSQYDGEIAFLDDQLGKLFSQLKETGFYNSSLIIITSDHGELFGTHGFYSHRTPMYEGVIRIPLIIKFPFNKRVGRDKKIVSLGDLYPTILSICGLPFPDGISGRAFGDHAASVVSEFYNFGIGKHQIIYDGKYKYMRYEHQREPELYDLRKDPEEQNNVADSFPTVTAMMDEKLNDWGTMHQPKHISSEGIKAGMSQPIKEQLQALGYIQ
ncbi:MAG: sulfatase [Deltaproteobacteria bacterium]|nr:sulfatase [Deltaproteobacteria bacterium]